MPHVPSSVEVLHLDQLESLWVAADEGCEDFAVLQIDRSNCRQAIGWLVRSAGRGAGCTVAAVGCDGREEALALVEAGAVCACYGLREVAGLVRLVCRHFRERLPRPGPRMDEMTVSTIVNSALGDVEQT